MSERIDLPIRLAFRREGAMHNVYIADKDTMKGAILIGSISVRAVENNMERWDSFKRLMSDFLAEIIESKVGMKPTMLEKKAPESERSGNC